MSLDVLNYTREWRGVKSPQKPGCAYSLEFQAMYHDIQAKVVDFQGGKPRTGWARLPRGWECIGRAGKISYLNHTTGREQHDSPFKGQPPPLSTRSSEQKVAPPGWHKIFDDWGRSLLFYDESYEEESKPTTGFSDLPSWVPNWAIPTVRDPHPFLSEGTLERDYWAGHGLPLQLCPKIDNATLTIIGARFDRIVRVADPWFPASDIPPIIRGNIAELLS